MATKIWTGNALGVKHKVSLTPGGTIEVGDLFNVTINGKTLSVAATTTVAADLCTAFLAAWLALDYAVYPEFGEITPSLDNDVTPTLVYLTGVEAGVPFTVSVATTEAGGGAADAQTWGLSTVTTATGPYHWDATANWEGGVIPVSTDDVIIDVPQARIRYGIDQNAVTLATLVIRGDVEIGLPRISNAGYLNYLETYLKISATKVFINTTGSLIRLHTGTNATTITVDGTGAAPDENTPAFQWRGANASNAIYRNAGSVGIAINPGETATLPTLAIGGDGNDEGLPCVIGAGVTLTTLRQSAGTVNQYCAATTINKTGGVLNILGNVSLTIAALNDYGGETNWSAPGTLTALTAGISLVRTGHQAGTITNGTILKPDAFPRDPNKTITYSNAIVIPAEGLTRLEIGYGMKIAPAPV